MRHGAHFVAPRSQHAAANVPVIAVLTSREADACSCQAPGPPCETMFSATVFVGKVISSKPTQPTGGTNTTTFEVVETLHAETPLGKTVDLTHQTNGNFCGIVFDVGKTYVVYAGGANGQLSVGACSRTHRLRANDEDVAYAHALPKRLLAKVEGRLVRMEGHEKLPLEKSEVRAADAGVSTKVATNGTFTLDLPPGTHQLQLVSEVATLWERASTTVVVPHAASCAKPILNVQWNGRIGGRVTGPDGGVVAGVDVFALPQKGDPHWRTADTTKSDGTFEIGGLAPGAYLLAVSPEDFGGLSPTSPFPTTWAPGVNERKKAKPVTVTPAGRAGPIEFVVPQAMQVISLKVVVKSKTGAVVQGAQVNVAPENGNRSTGAGTDASGAVVVKELGGTVLVVRACSTDMKKCVTAKRAFDGDAIVNLTLPE